MPVDCQRSTSGGKGNIGMFIERDPNICAAGLPTAQPDERLGDCLQHYLLKDEADALIGDAIIPPTNLNQLLPLRHPIPIDKRYAGPFCDMAQIVNPPIKTKFQTLVADFKDTAYSSYWKMPVGRVRDPVPMLPEGFDVYTTFGKATGFHGRLYDVVMPKKPYPDRTPSSKRAGVQLERNYCSPPYQPDVTYGHRTLVDKRGTYAKCCITDDKVTIGTANRTIINTIQTNYQDMNQPSLGKVLAPNDNISDVPKGYTFGKLKPLDNLPECLTTCDINPGMESFRKCLKHLNTLRKGLSKRFLPTFFRSFYLNLKHFDKVKTGWLPKEIVYKCCGAKFIRFDPTFIEPLLSMWKAFDGTNIEYKTFVHVINYREPSPEIPKIPDVPEDCLDFRTTYTEMVKPGQVIDDRLMAGLPSGRYFDLDYPITPERCTKADRTCLPHESDMKSCLCPSVLTLLHVNHRDMYEKREPHVVRRVFEAAGETFTDERFHNIWEEAKKYHSQGWICYETFRQALNKNNNTVEVVKE
ncbi:hypothetical protein K1T71_010246 [Dendrolimus kikuchii]|uniref:Uncharacterized protein n=1 Tax=Dendrolimus kikuchii TaxID=765133 RepID=A0ACC1CR96_9NEOP|nr:hypothetical protein K1T71_010246 [Dendrolimus kikuchii]